MISSPPRSVAAVGDAGDVRAWSGIPFHFLQAARAAGFASVPWRVDLGAVEMRRKLWNLSQPLRGRRFGGFQYSDTFLQALMRQVPPELPAGEVISFNQHFPPWEAIARAGGQLSLYIDATFPDLLARYGFADLMDRRTAEEALHRERETFAFSRYIIGFQRWASDGAVRDCGADPARVFTICPGANIELPADFVFPDPPAGRAGKDRPLVLGFVGRDWRRKGLPFLCDVRDELARRDWKVLIRTVGVTAQEHPAREGVELAGVIDKRRELPRFIQCLTSCDVGCLFSGAEATGMSTLEFLRLGVPVAGYTVDGMGDCLPPDAGFAFAPGAAVDEVADQLEAYLRDEARQEEFRRNARRWSPLVTWERCVAEMQELWETGTVRTPARPWLGLTMPAASVDDPPKA